VTHHTSLSGGNNHTCASTPVYQSANNIWTA